MTTSGVPRVGDAAPDFTAATDSGDTLTLSTLRGRIVVLFFYPKDDTPG
jgi:peroxiredoxin Q/BCP